eukprot:TRINITY_DN7491_c0_g2_i1.p1 TRINITY_DN7491_c0_g2~~TRINITY_DN7491_c0_g2_i1.p1  ORF type:complete len:155 (+),score=1.50 TRINITY_DN7491_c0_g2_i1:72-536(+)
MCIRDRAESSNFCDFFNFHNFRAHKRTHVLTLACAQGYTGPTDGGLSTVVGYLVSFYTKCSNKVIAADLSDPEVKERLLNDREEYIFRKSSKKDRKRSNSLLRRVAGVLSGCALRRRNKFLHAVKNYQHFHHNSLPHSVPVSYTHLTLPTICSV